MLTIPPAIAELLKSKMMVGDNRPTGKITIGGQPGGGTSLLELLLDGNNVKAYRCGSVTNPSRMSNFVTDSSGNEYCVVADATSGNLMRGTMDENEDYLLKNYPITALSSIGITIPRAASNLGFAFEVLLKKLSDGSVLMFHVVPMVASTQNLVVNCYKSASGDGDDFEFLSTAYTEATQGTVGVDGDSLRDVFVTDSGAIIVSIQGHVFFSAGFAFNGIVVCRSIDNGATWTTTLEQKTAFYFHQHQMAQLPDGTLVFGYENGYSYEFFVYSTNDGASWSIEEVSGWTQNNHASGLYCEGNYIYKIGFAESTNALNYLTGTLDYATIKTYANWQDYEPSNFPSGVNRDFIIYKNGLGRVVIQWLDDGKMYMAGFEPQPPSDILTKSITIDRTKGSASQATITLDNKGGIYSPDNAASEWAGVFWPNKQTAVTMGYGAEQVQVFRGLIDEVQMTTYPAELTITARDYSKLALDQQPQRTVDGVTYYALLFEGTTPEAIFTELATMAGWSADKIHADVTGAAIKSIQFGHESIADCFQRLAELVSWEWFCDEEGHLYFRAAKDPEAASVYEFTEGVDIFGINYRISDAELYRTVVAWASDEDGGVVKASTTWAAADYNNLLPLRTLIINAADLATTQEGCQAIADTAAAALAPKVREVNFVVVGNPYLQIGDVVKVKETTTTISELYRILEISHQMDAEGSPVFATALRCYHFGAEEEGEEE